jgi:rfaE bifunctional protein kinase chain/domain
MSVEEKRLRELVPLLAGRRVVVLGDLILDEYLVGRPSRVSREAPVLVLEFTRRFCRPGGAGNPAVNIRALGSTAYLVGVAGDDQARQTLSEELNRAGLDDSRIVAQPGGRTAVKTRLLAEDSSSRQHVARIDYAAPRPDATTRPELERCLRDAVEQFDASAILLSDYRGGVVGPATIQLARDLGREHKILTAADSQGELAQFSGIDLVKCNLGEAEVALGRQIADEADVERAGKELLASLDARHVVITRGPDGMSAFERENEPIHLPAANRTEVFDVTGAGDTVIAVLTLALVAGAALIDAAQLANIAAGLVVRRLGVATASPAELQSAIGSQREAD